MPTQPLCQDCHAPAIVRPGKPDRCAECAAIAQQIANQKCAAMVAAIRTLKGEQKNEGVAA